MYYLALCTQVCFVDWYTFERVFKQFGLFNLIIANLVYLCLREHL